MTDQHPDIHGHVSDAVRDACKLILGKIVSFGDSEKIANMILSHMDTVNKQYVSEAEEHNRQKYPDLMNRIDRLSMRETILSDPDIESEVRPIDNASVHLTHCYQGEYDNTCKYGDSDCPAALITALEGSCDLAESLIESHDYLGTGSCSKIAEKHEAEDREELSKYKAALDKARENQ